MTCRSKKLNILGLHASLLAILEGEGVIQDGEAVSSDFCRERLLLSLYLSTCKSICFMHTDPGKKLIAQELPLNIRILQGSGSLLSCLQ